MSISDWSSDVCSSGLNQGYTQRDAIKLGNLIRECNIRWFEEPCRWYNDRSSMGLVRNITGIPVAAGQSEYHRGGCRDLFIDKAVDVCNFDASWSGGPTEWRRVELGRASCRERVCKSV